MSNTPVVAFLIIMFLSTPTPRAAQVAPRAQAHTLTGEFRTHAKFHSKFLTTDRDVLVYLPPGYAVEEQRRYPVLYLHDGQNLFDGATSFVPGQEWRVDETAQALVLARAVEPVIIVGVYNTGRERVEEYTPSADPKFKVGGKADLYGRLLVEELKPFVDSHYRTKAGAADTGLGGSSLGGLVTMYLGLRYPEAFGKLAVVSPSVWWDRRRIVSDVKAFRSKPRARVWLDMGTDEGANAIGDARLLRDALVSKGWQLGRDLNYFEAEGGKHSEAAWAARVDPILRFLFPKK
ncbi:MAG TPA: alpha/beta hydrolase-fold protein [Pyrinomonadaceae bacterium]|nr:alpha/beta hydrolase-fold protein [Pyrinomonadaceae bacterium]